MGLELGKLFKKKKDEAPPDVSAAMGAGRIDKIQQAPQGRSPVTDVPLVPRANKDAPGGLPIDQSAVDAAAASIQEDPTPTATPAPLGMAEPVEHTSVSEEPAVPSMRVMPQSVPLDATPTSAATPVQTSEPMARAKGQMVAPTQSDVESNAQAIPSSQLHSRTVILGVNDAQPTLQDRLDARLNPPPVVSEPKAEPIKKAEIPNTTPMTATQMTAAEISKTMNAINSAANIDKAPGAIQDSAADTHTQPVELNKKAADIAEGDVSSLKSQKVVYGAARDSLLGAQERDIQKKAQETATLQTLKETTNTPEPQVHDTVVPAASHSRIDIPGVTSGGEESTPPQMQATALDADPQANQVASSETGAVETREKKPTVYGIRKTPHAPEPATDTARMTQAQHTLLQDEAVRAMQEAQTEGSPEASEPTESFVDTVRQALEHNDTPESLYAALAALLAQERELHVRTQLKEAIDDALHGGTHTQEKQEALAAVKEQIENPKYSLEQIVNAVQQALEKGNESASETARVTVAESAKQLETKGNKKSIFSALTGWATGTLRVPQAVVAAGAAGAVFGGLAVGAGFAVVAGVGVALVAAGKKIALSFADKKAQ